MPDPGGWFCAVLKGVRDVREARLSYRNNTTIAWYSQHTVFRHSAPFDQKLQQLQKKLHHVWSETTRCFD